MLYFQLQHLDHLIMYHCWHKVSKNVLIMWLYGNYGIVLLSEPSMWELIKIVTPKIKAKWKFLANVMGYDTEDIEGFDEGGRNLKGNCINLFTNWLTTGHGPTPKTYYTLLKYIRKVDKLTAASEQIEKELIKGKD